MFDTPERKILIVDDDPNNILILKTDLEDQGYETLSAVDGLEGWNMLKANQASICLILLDRMMPKMNGMQFMQRLRNDPQVANIPVIMQTAAAEREQVNEGIKAGVYYYLTKPYDNTIMLSLVAAAIENYGQYSRMRKELLQHKNKLQLARNASFEVQTLDDARYLTTFLANFYPNPERTVLGIWEILVNAIEHGNLGIGYNEKTQLTRDGLWADEIERRLALPAHCDKRVRVHFARHRNEIELRIKDEGEGFNWQRYLHISADRATDNHGRGIALSNLMSFDSMEYIGKGNEVICRVITPTVQ